MSLNLIPHKQTQRGSMIIMALFIIIVLSLLAATMLTTVSNASSSVLSEVYGLRAQQAAKAGLETLLLQSFPSNNAPQVCQTTIVSPASFSLVEGLDGCQFEARCDSQDISHLGLNYRHYKFSSTGFCELDDSLVSRTLSVDAIEELTP